jgi:transposase-like protein
MKFLEIIDNFRNNEDACVEYLANLRWATQRYCPYCKSTQISRHTEKNRRSRFQCSGCRKSFSPTVGTIMHKTKLPLFKWFLAVSLLSDAKKSMATHQIARHLDLPIKTAYALTQRIRKGLIGQISPFLQGIVEIDECYIGGKPRYKGTSKRGHGCNKMKVIGVVERGGKVIAKGMTAFNKKVVKNLILENVDISNSSVYTDESVIYSSVNTMLPHESVNHGAEEYVKGGVRQ